MVRKRFFLVVLRFELRSSYLVLPKRKKGEREREREREREIDR
jgi:hypothetical protein